MQMRRLEHFDQLRLVSSTPRLLRGRENRDTKPRVINFKTKEIFLTDNTATDQTKSSNQARTVEVQKLQYTIKRLERENCQLKDTILTMKASAFYSISEQKVKKLIKENEELKIDLKIIKKQFEKVMIEKDFLQRNNRALKQKYQQLTRQLNKPVIQSRIKTDYAQIKEYELLEDVQDFFKENKPMNKTKRSISSDKNKMWKKKVNGSGKMEEKSNPQGKKIKEGTSRRLADEYCIVKTPKQQKRLGHA